MHRVAIIPARGGSKRIPRKNIKEFCGKPMIAWSIEAARSSGCFDKVIVSTDDAEIAEVARGGVRQCLLCDLRSCQVITQEPCPSFIMRWTG